jgi:hypothetical protein
MLSYYQIKRDNMIKLKILDIDLNSVSIGDKIQFYYDDEPDDDIFEVKLFQTDDSIEIRAYPENCDMNSPLTRCRLLGGKYQYDFKIIQKELL